MLLSHPLAPASARSAKSAVVGVKNDLVDWLGRNNPVYDKARLSHIADSKPINQMKVGQLLEDALVAPGTGAERSAAFSAKVRVAETKISKSTGMPLIDDLTPEQLELVKNIELDFARNAAYKELSSKGMDSLKERIGAVVVPPTGLLMPLLSAARSWANTGLGTGYEKGLQRLAPLMADPQAVARAMREASPAQRRLLEATIDKYIAAGMPAGASQAREQNNQGLLSR